MPHLLALLHARLDRLKLAPPRRQVGRLLLHLLLLHRQLGGLLVQRGAAALQLLLALPQPALPLCAGDSRRQVSAGAGACAAGRRQAGWPACGIRRRGSAACREAGVAAVPPPPPATEASRTPAAASRSSSCAARSAAAASARSAAASRSPSAASRFSSSRNLRLAASALLRGGRGAGA